MSNLRVVGAALVAALFVLGYALWPTTNQAEIKLTPEDQTSSGALADLVIFVSGEATGEIRIDLLEDVAPQHAERLKELARNGAYDNVVFHRVIDGFMAQTGDIQFGKAGGEAQMAGRGGSDLPDLPAEFSDIPFDRGVVGMARSQSPNSANSQFFIMFKEGHFLNGQYTVVGRVTEGMDIVDKIKRGAGPSGSVSSPQDVMETVSVVE